MLARRDRLRGLQEAAGAVGQDLAGPGRTVLPHRLHAEGAGQDRGPPQSRLRGLRAVHAHHNPLHGVIFRHSQPGILASSTLLGRVDEVGSVPGDGLSAGATGAGPDAEQGLELAEYGVESQAGAGAFGSLRSSVQNA